MHSPSAAGTNARPLDPGSPHRPAGVSGPFPPDRCVVFDSNNAGGVTGGVSTGQPLVVRLAVKPTPTIDRKQHTIDKYTLENKDLEAITRRDPTIVSRIWPVAENYTSLVLLDLLMVYYGYSKLRDMYLT